MGMRRCGIVVLLHLSLAAPQVAAQYLLPDVIDPTQGGGGPPSSCPATPDDSGDDTACLQESADLAAGRTLWIPKGVFLVSSGGIHISSGTTVAGEGTLKNFDGTASRLLDVSNTSKVTIRDITFDGNVGSSPPPVWGGGACPTDNTQYRHAIGAEGASDLTVERCTFQDLAGDGVYIDRINSSSPCSVRVRVQGNRFFGNLELDLRERESVGLVCGEQIQIQDNIFVRSGRPCMPGAIDLEVDDNSGKFIKDVVIAGNEILGDQSYSGHTAECSYQVGISVANRHTDSIFENIVVSNNTIRGCLQQGILVVGAAGTPTSPVTITGNSIASLRSSYNVPITGIGVEAYGSTSPNVVISDNSVHDIPGTTAGDVGAGISVLDSDAIVSGNYVSKAYTWGIWLRRTAGNARRFVATGNRLDDCGVQGGSWGDTPGGIRLDADDAVITGNQITSSSSTYTPTGIFISEGARNVLSDNVILGATFASFIVSEGPQFWGLNQLGGTKLWGNFGPTNGYPPTSGTWAKGQLMYNPDPDPGEPIGWVCTSAAPLAWKEFGTIASSASSATFDDEWDTIAEINAHVGDVLVTQTGTLPLSNKTLDTASGNVLKVNGNVLSAAAGTATVSLPNVTDQLVGRATTDTLSNKTLDATLATNFVYSQVQLYEGVGSCTGTASGAAALGAWNTATTSTPAKTCNNGTNVKPYLTLDFADATTSMAIVTFQLPPGWQSGSATDLTLSYFSTVSSPTGNFFWEAATACSGVGETIDPSFTTQTLADAAIGANLRNDVVFSGLNMAGCAAGELLRVRIQRLGGNGSDTVSGSATAKLLGASLGFKSRLYNGP